MEVLGALLRTAYHIPFAALPQGPQNSPVSVLSIPTLTCDLPAE